MKTIVSIYGKINFRSLSRYSGLAEKTFRRWFKTVFDFAEFNQQFPLKIFRTNLRYLITLFQRVFS